MNQINKEEFTEVGYIQKPHGLKGEVIVAFDKEFEATFEEVEILFIQVDGALVPFFIEEDGFRFRAGENAICQLLFVDSLARAKELAGCKVFVLDNDVIENKDYEVTSALIGLIAFDEKFGKIGRITRVDDFSGNLVVTISHQRAEIMVPLSDEVIKAIDQENGEIRLNCPDGLIEIYLG
jgi:16S rRNA processing protein RimM